MTFTLRAGTIRSTAPAGCGESFSRQHSFRPRDATRAHQSCEGAEQVATTGARVGERLRAIRRQKGLSLHDVEARSNLEFKASVLGAYERGERAISVPRLLRLSEIYEVPSDQLLPRDS